MFFAYTERGRRTALANGMQDSRIVVLMNTIDTTGLRSAVERTSNDSRHGPPAEWNVVDDGCVCAFVGALDRSKRLDFLFDACDTISKEMPSFRLLVAGDGPERDAVLRKANQSTYVRYIGRVGDTEKAEIARACQLLLNPGRVGLVAVDSFVMATPLVTTDWPLHAPEFDYLVDDENSVVTEDSEEIFARSVIDLLRDTGRLDRLVEGCRASAGALTMEALVGRFADGILAALDGQPS
jgi:glycosyltransferase involved in cell wall biosynthesis